MFASYIAISFAYVRVPSSWNWTPRNQSFYNTRVSLAAPYRAPAFQEDGKNDSFTWLLSINGINVIPWLLYSLLFGGISKLKAGMVRYLLTLIVNPIDHVERLGN
jgi:hypothetical protein